MGSSFHALLAVMCMVSLLGGLLYLEGYVRAAGSAVATSDGLIVVVACGFVICTGGSSAVGGVVGAETSSAAVIVGIGSEISAVSRVGTDGAMSGAVGSSGVGVGVRPSDSLIISMSIGDTGSAGSAAGAA